MDPRASIVLLAFVVACTSKQEESAQGDAMKSTITVTSSAFQPGSPIPRKHAFEDEGQNVSPQLSWSGVPAAAKELALICDDPDAPSTEPWVHWVIYAIPPGVSSLSEGIPVGSKELAQPAGARQGVNGWRRIGWGGPSPPPGAAHHYHFKLCALDATLGLAPGSSKRDLVKAMQGHVLATGELIGTYKR